MGGLPGSIAGSVRGNGFFIVGFALFCCMLRQPYFGSVLALDLVDVHFVRGLLDASIIVLAAIAVGVGLRYEPPMRSHVFTVLSAAFSAGGVCLLAAPRFIVAIPSWAASGGAILCACGFMMLAIIWMRALASVKHDKIVPLAMAAFVVSLVMAVADLVSSPLKELVNVLIPVLSALCASMGARKADHHVFPHETEQGVAHIIKLVVVAIAIEILCCSLVRGTWSSGGVGYGGVTSLKTASYLISAALGLAFFVASSFLKNPEKSAVFIAAVSLIAVIALIVLVVVNNRSIIGSCVTSLYSVLLVLLFAILAVAAQRNFATHLTCAGAFSLAFAAASLVTYTVVPYLFSFDAEQSSNNVLPVALAAALVVAVGACLVISIRLRAQIESVRSALGDASSDEVWNRVVLQRNPVESPSAVTIEVPVYISQEEALDRSVEKATSLYRLTAREADIVRLFAQGRTIKQAASELSLAPSTVQGYTKSIYAKLGVHGKKEIRDLLNGLLED